MVTAGCTRPIAVEKGSHALDGYPGFGRTERAVLRDDAITFWESYHRELLVSFCMESNEGLLYWPESYRDRGFIRQLVGYLGAIATRGPTEQGREMNESFVKGLDRRSLNRYNLALWGETTTDLELANDENPKAPPSRLARISSEDFAKRGCAAKGFRRLPGLMDSIRELQDEWSHQSWFATQATTRVLQARRNYRDCMLDRSGLALDGPGAVEEFLAPEHESTGSARKAVQAARDACDPIWSNAYASAEEKVARRFVQQHAEALESVRKAYSGVKERMRDERRFLDFVGQEAGLVVRVS